ncbi:MAG: DNA polymerase III subunit beta [Phycisphaeraceae bacterium]|nr:MAG: DNA polymerase III subunit beta [Phycisphaeraceae bacterium]
MKVICDRAALLDAINLVSGVVATRTPRPQLTCVKLTAMKEGDAGRLVLAATDAEVSLRLSTANVDVQEEGEALIPAQKLQQIIAAEENEPTLTLETDEDMMHVRGADARFKVFGYPSGDFPPVPEFPGADERGVRTVFRVGASELDTLISRTLFATARENSRYAINGVLMKVHGKKIEMVATDGRRLALARGVADSAPGDEAVSCIIPTKALALCAKLIDGEDAVRIAITENQAIFAFGHPEEPPRAALATSLVEGAFPPYEDVIPRDQDKKAVFDVAALRSGVRRAALLTNEESRGVRLAFTAGKGKGKDSGANLRLSSRAPEMGEAEIDVDVSSYDGEDIEIGFNPNFITDALKIIDEPQVIMELKASNKPGLIKSGTEFTYVVMPVSLQ